MNLQEHVPLAPRTTFGIGGEARFLVEATTEAEIDAAITFAQEQNLPLRVLSEGSNVLIPDEGFSGVVLHIALRAVAITDDDADGAIVTGGAGALWDDVVDVATARNFFGIENLAGIPGSLGGAVVQNIGAYGAELANTFLYADTIDSTTRERCRILKKDAALAYRTSFFKQKPTLIITRVALHLTKEVRPNIAYADLARLHAEGTSLATPGEIATAVRHIRSKKFPQGAGEGTAVSFFKNPVLTQEVYAALAIRYPDLPGFSQTSGGVKVSLAWLLDHVLGLKGFSVGAVRLYEKQPIVIVATKGATAHDVDVFVKEIETRVFDETGVHIEREVETFGK